MHRILLGLSLLIISGLTAAPVAAEEQDLFTSGQAGGKVFVDTEPIWVQHPIIGNNFGWDVAEPLQNAPGVRMIDDALFDQYSPDLADRASGRIVSGFGFFIGHGPREYLK